MSKDETALTFALLRVLSSRIGAVKKGADAEITSTWQVSDRNAAVLPDKTKIGTVTLAKGRTSADIVDADAFLAWVLEMHPEEIEQVQITRVNQHFSDRILAFARAQATSVDPMTGEEIPGLRVQEGAPYATTRLNDDAAELVAKAWQNGELTELIGSLMQPAIEAGES